MNDLFDYLLAMRRGGGSGGSAILIVETTYADLVSAKEAGTLKEGAFYRITDYETMINGTYDFTALVGTPTYLHYARSASHQFDLIVQALDDSTLSEHAKAIKHDGDTYFSDSNLSAWDLMYTTNNDNTKYLWADPDNGKGVIYFMRDEFDNEAPYDFKNIQFLAYAIITNGESSVNLRFLDYQENDNPYRFGTPYDLYRAALDYLQSGEYYSPLSYMHKDFAVGINILGAIQYPSVDDTYLATFEAGWYYTFHRVDGDVDASLNSKCRNNKIAICYDPFTQPSSVRFLNCNIFYSDVINGVGFIVYDNSFSPNCYFNVLHNVNDASFGTDCRGNYVSQDCAHLHIGSECVENAFGRECTCIQMQEKCTRNLFGDLGLLTNAASNISLGVHCDENLFQSGSYNIRFGNNCSGNAFSNTAFDIVADDFCQDIRLNNIAECLYFKAYCDGITLNLAKNVSFELGVKGFNAGVQHYERCTILSYDYSALTIPAASNTYENFISINSNGVVKVWNPADLAT